MTLVKIIYLIIISLFFTILSTTHVFSQSSELKEAFQNTKKFYKEGKLGHAINFAKKAVEISKEEFGKEHKITATLIENLGTIEMDLELYKEAEISFRTSTQIRKKILDADSPEIAESTDLLAVSLRKQLFYDKAMEYHNEAILIITRALTKSNPHGINETSRKGALFRARAMYTKALIDIKNYNHENAIGYLKTASRIFTTTLGKNKLELKETYILMLDAANKIKDKETINLARSNIDKLL